MIIIGIDPGTHNFGLGIVETDEKLKIINAIPICINADDILASNLSVSSNDFRDRHNVLLKYMDLFLLDLLEEPVAFAYEIPHFDAQKPQSYGILMHHIYLLQEHITNVYNVPIYGYRPTSIKASIGANKKLKGENAKDAVLRCMQETKELVEVINSPLSLFTDDAIDSVLIAYKHITEARAEP